MKLSGNVLNNVFSEIDVIDSGSNYKVTFRIMKGLSAELSEGWKTGIAIDASISMISSFGRTMDGTLPPDVKEEYIKKNWIKQLNSDGRKASYFEKEAHEDAIKKGYLKQSPNLMDVEIKKFSAYLAENLDFEGKTEVIYWALGPNGDEIEKIDTFTSASIQNTNFQGPKEVARFGKETHLFPAISYFEKSTRNAKRGFFVCITDGNINDLESVIKFTKDLAKEIEGGKRNFFKAVIIGVGDDISEKQMIELDDLDTGTEVDIWDHKIARNIRDVIEIFAELVSENEIVAPIGSIYNDQKYLIKRFNDGVPAKYTFEIPKTSTSFTLEVGNQSFKQDLKI